ncbi:hypothetical protein QP580_12850, partial [Prevotella bivia]|nr:hypothetical protein [Prevotella bivia]
GDEREHQAAAEAVGEGADGDAADGADENGHGDEQSGVGRQALLDDGRGEGERRAQAQKLMAKPTVAISSMNVRSRACSSRGVAVEP